VAANPGLFSKNLLVHTALIADDNATERTTLKEIFKRQPGWELIQANDGQDALDRLHAGLRPDLLLVDLRMPKLDGFAFIQRIREDASLRNLRVVVVSSDHNRDQVRALAQLNISGYLLKPFDEAKVKVTLLQAAGIEVNQTPASDIITPPTQPLPN
jgi:CheY-like chemotaxis protein